MSFELFLVYILTLHWCILGIKCYLGAWSGLSMKWGRMSTLALYAPNKATRTKHLSGKQISTFRDNKSLGSRPQGCALLNFKCYTPLCARKRNKKARKQGRDKKGRAGWNWAVLIPCASQLGKPQLQAWGTGPWLLNSVHPLSMFWM